MRKNILVVGGAFGIGKAISELYLQQGHYVAVFDISDLPDKTSYEKMKGDEQKFSFYQGDVRDEETIIHAVNDMNDRFHSIDILIYATGIYPNRVLIDMTSEEWDQVMDINLKGAFLFSKYVANKMISNQTKGQIITISSGSYKSGRVGSSHYCASKAGLVLMTKVLAMELGRHKIRVNSISPGLIDNRHIDPEYKELFSQRIPSGRIGEPSDIAEFVTGFTAIDSEYLTGQVIGVDGALSAGQYGLPMSSKEN